MLSRDNVERLRYPVLIIGAGAAGARTAIELQKNDIEPLVVSKRDYGDAHTTWARGGINAALGNRDEEDNWAIHAADTLDEGHFINDPSAVEVVTKNMPDLAEELNDWGMDFTLTEDGELEQRYFGAQSYRRTCFAGDYTGEALMETLVSKAQDLNIPYRDDIYITELLTEGDKCYGAIGYDTRNGHLVSIRSEYVVLAAGGHTAIYNRHSSREEENTGDGIGLAYRAGAELMDMEFVQFHPTGMVGDRYGEEWDGRLVTEAVRGEGGRLYNSEGERFMEKYSPKQMELDARDVVARAIEQEIREGRGTENGGVFLDISHKEKDFIKKRLPRMYERFKSLGVDISEEPMEVAPTAHYIMGGVKFDARTGETGVESLRVAGETTAGVHGANRLGGNSLAETVTVGREVGRSISKERPKKPEVEERFEDQIQSEIDRLNNLLNSDGDYTYDQIIERLGDNVESNAGIRRSEDSINEGLRNLEEIRNMYDDTKFDGEVTDIEFEMLNNIRFMLIAAEATLRGALERKESRGAHYRTDHTEKEQDYCHNIVYKNSSNGMQTSVSDVEDPSDEIKEAIDQEHELDYHHLE